MLAVLHVRAFKDNYIWLLRGKNPRHVAVVDPGDAAPVLAALQAQDLLPVAILCTHHHRDHSGGIDAIRAHYPVPVYGPAREHILGVTHPVAEGQRIRLPELEQDYQILDIPGHTSGHIAFYGQGLLFCGDTLFSAGCGRLFEGTPAQLYASLRKLAALPPDTAVYCGHEYTLANLRFAQAVEPQNADVLAYEKQALQRRSADLPTLPSSIGLELRVNPFLRLDQSTVRSAALRRDPTLSSLSDQKSDMAGAAVFATLRRWKDEFNG